MKQLEAHILAKNVLIDRYKMGYGQLIGIHKSQAKEISLLKKSGARCRSLDSNSQEYKQRRHFSDLLIS